MSRRQVVLDTETTGLEPGEGHRIIEIGCVELTGRRRGATMRWFLNPERQIDEGAIAVHGITREQLAGKPRFAEVADDLLRFIEGAELIIHNAPFDVGFLDAELARAGRPERIGVLCGVYDTLLLARQMHPGQRNNLDALCKRYSIDNSQRSFHGALLDAEILADVYLAMTGGQAALLLDASAEAPASGTPTASGAVGARGEAPTGPVATVVVEEADRAAHARRLQRLRQSAGSAVWDSLEPPEPV
jgi:DNA polymerase-3 subunit epsilon